MKKFDEIAFVCALVSREEDARQMRALFNPEWLRTKEYVPVVKAIFEYLDKYKVSPSFAALHEFMEEKDKGMYDSRYRETLTMFESIPMDKSKQIMAIAKAKDSAAAMSLSILINSTSFQEMITEGAGDLLRSEVARWLNTHTESGGEGTVDIRTGLDRLINEVGWEGRPTKIRTGIECIDEWTSGGLRPGQLGIIMAPTGNGKSAVLMNIAHYVATGEEKSVLFLTNELTLNEQLERFLVRMQAPDTDEAGNPYYHPLHKVQDDPSRAYRGLQRRWQYGLEKRLFVSSVDLYMTADDIEQQIKMLRAEHGFKPSVIVLDFMERMASSKKAGDSNEKEWVRYGNIAKELVRVSKRTNTAIWTAVQTNRGGLNKGATMSMEFGQGSIRHFQEAACVIGLRKEYVQMDAEGEVKVECLAFKELKQRHAAMNDREVRLRCELERMYITPEHVIPPDDESIEIADDKVSEGMKGGRQKPKSQWEVKKKNGSH